MSTTATPSQCPMTAKKIDFKTSGFVAPNKVSECKWTLADNVNDYVNPHTQRPFDENRPRILDNIISVIGHTPIIKLNRIPQAEGIKCEMYAKCEFLNPGGSVKDRIGYRMVLDAEKKGLLKPGCTVIEPTSGNTGIGLAMACAVRGYKCIIVMPEKMSDEKVGTLRALGAKIIRTPTEAAYDDSDSLIIVAQTLQKQTENSIILDQYRNPGNPLAHYDGTGSEILWQMNNKVDCVVIGAGTGGTVTGIGRKIKEKLGEQCKIVAVDPPGSILSLPESLNITDTTFYEVEGIGYDFLPTVLDRTVVDEWIKVNDQQSFDMARRLQAEEGILCGGSSGAALSAAIRVAKTMNENQKVVVILPDSIRNYMSKFVNDSWMEARELKESVNVHGFDWWNKPISALGLSPPETVQTDEIIGDVLKKMKANKLEQIPLIDGNGGLKGVITRAHTLNRLVNDKIPLTDQIVKCIYKQFRKVKMDVNLGRVSRILEREPFIIVYEQELCQEKVTAVITKELFLDYILKQSSEKATNGVATEITNGTAQLSINGN